MILNGIYEVLYNPSEVIKLRVREQMTTLVKFPDWEQIEFRSIGDESIFEVKQLTKNVILIKPKGYAGVDSNISLVGKSGNIYTLYARVDGLNSKHIPDLGVRIKVPGYYRKDSQKSRLKRSNNNKSDYLSYIDYNPSELNFNYAMAGDKSIAPNRVYSDGKRLWLDYDSNIDKVHLPVIYNVIDGYDVPVNYHREGNKIVVHSIGKLTLKNGSKVTCVYSTNSSKRLL